MVDYHDFVTKDTPKEDRRKLGVGDIYSNTIQCLHCLDIIRSRNRHDFRFCKCEKVAVDGGSWYGKVTGNLEDWKSLIELFNDVEESVQKNKRSF